MNSQFIKISLFLISKSALLMAAAEMQDGRLEPDTHTVVVLPDQYQTMPTQIIHTSETQIETEYIDHYIELHVWEPAEGAAPIYLYRYLVTKHLELGPPEYPR